MATAGLQKTSAEIIPVSADFGGALISGDSLIGGNVTVVVKNLLTDATVSGAIVPSSETVAGTVASCKIQGGSTGDLWVVQFATGPTTLGYTFNLEQNVEITTTPLASNLLCDFDEVKQELEIDPSDTSDDERLFNLIMEASDYFRTRTQRDFVFQKYVQTIRPTCYEPILRLYNWPVYAIDDVTLRQVNSGLDPFDVVKDTGTWGFRKDGWIWLLDDVWMEWPHENVITYRAGYPVIPKNIQRAVKAIAVWYHRLTGREGLAGEKIGSYSYTRARLTDFPANMKFELPDEMIEGVIGRYTRPDIDDQE